MPSARGDSGQSPNNGFTWRVSGLAASLFSPPLLQFLLAGIFAGNFSLNAVLGFAALLVASLRTVWLFQAALSGIYNKELLKAALTRKELFMPLPFPQQRNLEIVVQGVITSGGSGARNTFNVFHFRRNGTTGAIDKVAAEAAFQAAIGVPLCACLNNRWSQNNNNVRILNDPTDPYVTVSRVVVGGVAGDGLSSILWAYILMRTTLRGGKYRGAKRLGPLSEADVTAGGDDILNAAALARFTTLRNAILAGFTDSTGDVWVPCVVSRKGADFRASPATFIQTDVSQVLTNKRIGRTKVRETPSLY